MRINKWTQTNIVLNDLDIHPAYTEVELKRVDNYIKLEFARFEYKGECYSILDLLGNDYFGNFILFKIKRNNGRRHRNFTHWERGDHGIRKISKSKYNDLFMSSHNPTKMAIKQKIRDFKDDIDNGMLNDAVDGGNIHAVNSYVEYIELSAKNHGLDTNNISKYLRGKLRSQYTKLIMRKIAGV